MVLGPKPKLGSQPGSQEEGVAVEEAVRSEEGEVGEEGEAGVVVGFGGTGRLGWSVVRGGVVVVGSGLREVVETVAEMVELGLWKSWSSSLALGRGRRVALAGSMASPQSLMWKSVKLPENSFTDVSRRITFQVPTPDSPLGCVSGG